MSNLKKFAFGLAFVAVLFGVSFTSVSAQTQADLTAQFQLLLNEYNALAGTSMPATGGYSFTRDLSVGSTGADVVALQNILISSGNLVMPVGVAKGYFGELTKTAVMAWQTAHSISPVGKVGPITRAALNSTGGTYVPPTGGINYPAGCTSSMGFSVTTGMPCSGGSNLPAGCTSTTGFSPTSGVKCDGSTTPGGSDNTGPLTGGAGDITVDQKSSGLEDEVVEGDEDVPVLSFEVEPDGSDVEITSVRVEFVHTGSGSDQLDRYVDEVSIWLEGEEVGRVDVDEFDENNDVFSRNIPISNGVVGEDDMSTFKVAVTTTSNIDSDDLGENWVVGLGQIRFEDATGAILTDNTGNGVTTAGAGDIIETFTFEDLSTSGDIELRVSESDNDINEPHSIHVEDSNDTNDVDVLSFTLDAEGSDISLNALAFNVTSSGAGVTEIANDFRLMMGSEEVGNAELNLDCSGSTDDGFASTTDADLCVTITDLDDDDVVISDGDEAEFMLVADVNDIDGAFTSGDKLSVELVADATLSDNGYVDADDENGDALTVSDLSGSADSTNLEFLSTGISVTTVSTNNPTQNINVESSATDNTGLFEVTFDVTAIEDDAFIELGAATRGTAESDTGANFVLQDNTNSYAATTTGSIALSDLTNISGGSTSGNFIKIGAGQTARFKLAVTFDPAQLTGTSEGYRMYLYSVNFAATAVNATGQQVLTPEADYRTGATTIGN